MTGATSQRRRIRRPKVLIFLFTAVGSLASSVPAYLSHHAAISLALAGVATVSTGAGAVLATFPFPYEGAPVADDVTVKAWALPQRVVSFTGRAWALAEIASVHATALRPGVAVLTGIGAVGKTSVALEYAHRTGSDPAHALTVWISAGQRPKAVTALRELGVALGVEPHPDPTDMIRRTFAALGRHEPWLIVYDDATPETVAGLMPTSGDGAVLITSRGGDWGTVGTAIEIRPMADDEAVRLLLDRSRDTSEGAETHARVLAARLGGLPYALELAGAYCFQTCTLADYLRLLDGAGLGLLNRPSHGPNEIAARLGARKATRGRVADAQLLRVLSFLAAGYMPQILFTDHVTLLPRRLREAAQEVRQWHPLVTRLHDAGLIRAEPGLIWVHALLQEVERGTIANRTRTSARRLLARATAGLRADATAGWTHQRWRQLALQLVTAAFPNATDPKDWVACGALLPAALAALDGAADSPRPEVTTLATNVSRYYLGQGNHAAARDLLEQVVASRQRLLGPLHPDTLTSINALANAAFQGGDYARARDLQARNLEARRRVLGPDHPDTLASMNSLANARHRLADYAEARDLHEQTMAARTRVLGPEHPDTLQSMNNLAGLLHRMGDVEAARDLHTRALEARLRVLGPEHPSTLISMNNLALVLNGLGDIEAGRDLHTRTLETQRRVLGAEHPATLQSMNNLASALSALGDHAAARDLHAQTVETLRRVVGPEHPDTLFSMNDLAMALFELGDYAGARDLHAQTLAARRRVLGAEHPDTRISERNLQAAVDRLP